MNIQDLYHYITCNVPNFISPVILNEPGECYHYTSHWDKIESSGYMKGAKINSDLDRTQQINYLGEAEEDIGVVFAYENIENAREEGFGLDIIMIHYQRAIIALHKSEKALDDLTDAHLERLGINAKKTETPKTLLILTSDIISFEYIEKAK